MGYILTFNKETVPGWSKHVIVCQTVCSRQRSSVHANGINQNEKERKKSGTQSEWAQTQLINIISFLVISNNQASDRRSCSNIKKKVKLNLSHLKYFPKFNIPETHTKELSSNASDFLKPLSLLTPPNEQHDTPTFTEKQLLSLLLSGTTTTVPLPPREAQTTSQRPTSYDKITAQRWPAALK